MTEKSEQHDKSCLTKRCTISCPTNGLEIRRMAKILWDVYKDFAGFCNGPIPFLSWDEKFGHPLFNEQARMALEEMRRTKQI